MSTCHRNGSGKEALTPARAVVCVWGDRDTHTGTTQYKVLHFGKPQKVCTFMKEGPAQARDTQLTQFSRESSKPHGELMGTGRIVWWGLGSGHCPGCFLGKVSRES